MVHVSPRWLGRGSKVLRARSQGDISGSPSGADVCWKEEKDRKDWFSLWHIWAVFEKATDTSESMDLAGRSKRVSV